MRAFFAIVPPPSLYRQLQAIILSLQQTLPMSSINWMQVHHLHVTLQFLGLLKPELLPVLIETVKTELRTISRFEIELQQLELFPQPEAAKIISLTVEPADKLLVLANKLAQCGAGLQLPLDSKPFRAHMTLAKLHNQVVTEVLLQQVAIPVLAPIAVNEVVLFESRPAKGATNYYPLAGFPLF